MKRHELDDLLDVERGFVLVNLWDVNPPELDPMHVVMERVEERLGAGVRVLRLSAGSNRDIVERYRIDGTPIVLVFREGRLLARWRGRLETHEVLARLSELED